MYTFAIYGTEFGGKVFMEVWTKIFISCKTLCNVIYVSCLLMFVYAGIISTTAQTENLIMDYNTLTFKH